MNEGTKRVVEKREKKTKFKEKTKKQEEKHKRTAIFFTKVIPFFPGGINRVQNITSGNLKSTALKKKRKEKTQLIINGKNCVRFL